VLLSGNFILLPTHPGRGRSTGDGLEAVLVLARLHGAVWGRLPEGRAGARLSPGSVAIRVRRSVLAQSIDKSARSRNACKARQTRAPQVRVAPDARTPPGTTLGTMPGQGSSADITSGAAPPPWPEQARGGPWSRGDPRARGMLTHVAEDDAKSRNAHRQCAPGCFVCRFKSPWPPGDGSGVDDERRRLPARRTCDALVASHLPAAILVCNSRCNCNRLSTDPVAVRRVTSYALSC